MLRFATLLVICLFLPFAVQAQPQSAFTSDDFSATELDTDLWEIINPLGSGAIGITGPFSLDAALGIYTAPGIIHDLWGEVRDAPRIMQPALNQDFQLEVKFNTGVSSKFQIQGMIIEQDAANYLRFDFYSDGTGTYIFAAGFRDGQPAGDPAVNLLIGEIGITGLIMRVDRVGDQWLQSYSRDGFTWTPVGDFNFSLAVSQVGLFAGNTNSDPDAIPSHNAEFDYFFNRAENRSYEDGQPYGDLAFELAQIKIADVEIIAGQEQFLVTWKTNNPTFSTLEWGVTEDYGTTIPSDLARLYHRAVVTGLEPGGEYHFRISALGINGFDATSENYTLTTSLTASEPIISLWYQSEMWLGTSGGIGQNYFNIPGNVIDPDGDFIIDYDREPGEPELNSRFTFSLNGGAPQELSVGPDGTRLTNPGDFNVEIEVQDLLVGRNDVLIAAQDETGLIASQRVIVRFDPPRERLWVREDVVEETAECVELPILPHSNTNLPRDYTIDWASSDRIADFGQSVDGQWVLEENGIRSIQPGYDRLFAIGDMSWQDYEVTVPVTINAIDTAGYTGVSGGPGVGVIMRWQGHYPWTDEKGRVYQPRRGWFPLGVIGWYRLQQPPEGDPYHPLGDHFEFVGNQSIYLQYDEDVRVKLGVGIRYIFKLRVESTRPDQGSNYYLKVWRDGQPEPNDWLLDVEASSGNLYYGSVVLVAHHVDATFGNMTITQLDPPATYDFDCTVESAGRGNLRILPGDGYPVGRILEPNLALRVDGQAQGADGFIWWRLAPGE